MVKEQIKNNKTFYICEKCNFAYKEKELAEKCEAFCKKNHQCNIKITKHAVKL
ncbi:hypothetical protein GOV06_02205 [Candidatus Woesearchaeota archaeon]|nr:hypothetical protein [Candidatus Woesearchaeota archaeon]